MAIDTENKRRSSGCHMVLTVPPVPNVGVAGADRPHIAWVYRAFVESHTACDFLVVLELFLAGADIMEALCASAAIRESLSASADSFEALTAAGALRDALAATADVREALSATIDLNPC